jgi:hypothetical protein
MEAFIDAFQLDRRLLIPGDGIDAEDSSYDS